MSDELENMQSEPVQNESSQPEASAAAEPSVPAEAADAPVVKKRRGRPPKKRPEAEAESGSLFESVPEENPAAPLARASASSSFMRRISSVVGGRFSYPMT